MKLLYHYRKHKGRRVKQIYFVDTETVYALNGTSEPGYQLIFWPEGNASNSYITVSQFMSIAARQQLETNEAEIYLLTNP